MTEVVCRRRYGIFAYACWFSLTFAACVACGAVEPVAPEAAAEPFSEAEALMWLTDQLRTVQEPTVLTYRFEKSGTLEEGFTDTVEFKIEQLKADGMKSASLRFFTGERNFPVAPVESTDVNPVFKVFFQGDVYEMNRLTDTGGAAGERWRYFQRRIKLALAETATVVPTTVEFAGKQYAAQEIRFQPYANDPKRADFEKFADKTYSVTVADDLPGYLYRIQTVVPGKAAGDPPLIQETLELENAAPLTAVRP